MNWSLVLFFLVRLLFSWRFRSLLLRNKHWRCSWWNKDKPCKPNLFLIPWKNWDPLHGRQHLSQTSPQHELSWVCPRMPTTVYSTAFCFHFNRNRYPIFRQIQLSTQLPPEWQLHLMRQLPWKQIIWCTPKRGQQRLFGSWKMTHRWSGVLCC